MTLGCHLTPQKSITRLITRDEFCTLSIRGKVILHVSTVSSLIFADYHVIDGTDDFNVNEESSVKFSMASMPWRATIFNE